MLNIILQSFDVIERTFLSRFSLLLPSSAASRWQPRPILPISSSSSPLSGTGGTHHQSTNLLHKNPGHPLHFTGSSRLLPTVSACFLCVFTFMLLVIVLCLTFVSCLPLDSSPRLSRTCSSSHLCFPPFYRQSVSLVCPIPPVTC